MTDEVYAKVNKFEAMRQPDAPTEAKSSPASKNLKCLLKQMTQHRDAIILPCCICYGIAFALLFEIDWKLGTAWLLWRIGHSMRESFDRKK